MTHPKATKSAGITISPSSAERGFHTVSRTCGHAQVVNTVPDNRPGAPRGATRSESTPCNCGG
jgi:hypothetical protein